MHITYQDLRTDAQMEVWDEVRIYLVCAGYIEPRGEDEEYVEYEDRVNRAVDDYINRHNISMNYDLCPTGN